MVIDCSKCPEGAGCCGILPFKKEFLEKHKEKFQVKPVQISDSKEIVGVITEDLKCIFLNRETNLCAIYQDRPEVCRLFGTKEGILKAGLGLACPYFKPNGSDWSKAMKTRIIRQCRKNLTSALKKAQN